MALANTRKIMQENVTLLGEINDLRRELSQSKGTVHTLQATLSTTKKLYQMRGHPVSASAIAEQMPATPTLGDTMAKQHVERVIEMQKEEIKRLREQLEGVRPTSGRLPSLTTAT